MATQKCEEAGWVALAFDAGVAVPVCEHPKGMQFYFDETAGRDKPWQWMQMIAQLDDDSRRVIVQGGDGRSRGILGCALHQSGDYDHQRTFAARAAAEADAREQGLSRQEQKAAVAAVPMMKQWDFVISRADGSHVLLHPSYSHTSFSCKSNFPTFDGDLPSTGPGGTSGHGTYKYFAQKDVDLKCKFDAKRPVVPGPTPEQVGGTNRVRDATGAVDAGKWTPGFQ